MKLVWISDPHTNFISPFAAKEFGKAIQADAIIVTGDIAEANSFADALIDLQSGFGGVVYFILGNHDFYGGSFHEVEQKAKSISSNDLVYPCDKTPAFMQGILS